MQIQNHSCPSNHDKMPIGACRARWPKVRRSIAQNSTLSLAGRSSGSVGRMVKIAAAVVVVGSILTACSSAKSPPSSSTSSSTSSKSSYVIYVSASLSGVAATEDAQGVRGIKAAAQILNDEGGILGHHIVVDVYNDNADPATGVALLDRFLSSGHTPQLVISGVPPGSVGPALLPTLTQHKILSCSNDPDSGQNNPKLYPYAFNEIAAYPVEAQAEAKLIKAKGIKSVALLFSTDSFGVGAGAAMAAAMHEYGIKITATQSYSDSQTNMIPQLTALRASNPQAVVFDGLGLANNYVIESFQPMGWNIPEFGGPATLFGDLSAQIPSHYLTHFEAEALAISQYASKNSRSAALNKFIDTLNKTGGISQPLNDYSFYADCVFVTAQASTQAKSLNSSKVMDALEHLNHIANPQYVSLPYEGITPTDHLPPIHLSYFRLIKVGPLKNGMFES